MTRTRTITAVVAAIVILTGILITVIPHGGPQGRRPRPTASASSALPESPVTPIVDVSGLRWVDYHGYRMPVSAQDGPRDTSADLASGFADTPLGALLAMINIGVRTAWQFGPGIFQPTIEFQVTGPDASEMLSADRDAYGSGASQIADIRAYASIVAYQWVGYTPSDATADLVAEGPGSDGSTMYAATQIQAEWTGGDWRVVAPPGGDWETQPPRSLPSTAISPFPGRRADRCHCPAPAS